MSYTKKVRLFTFILALSLLTLIFSSCSTNHTNDMQQPSENTTSSEVSKSSTDDNVATAQDVAKKFFEAYLSGNTTEIVNFMHENHIQVLLDRRNLSYSEMLNRIQEETMQINSLLEGHGYSWSMDGIGFPKMEKGWGEYWDDIYWSYGYEKATELYYCCIFMTIDGRTSEEPDWSITLAKIESKWYVVKWERR